MACLFKVLHLVLIPVVTIVAEDRYDLIGNLKQSGTNWTNLREFEGSVANCAVQCTQSHNCAAYNYQESSRTCSLLPPDHYVSYMTTTEEDSDWVYFRNIKVPGTFLNQAGDKLCMHAILPNTKIQPLDPYYCFKAPLSIEEFKSGKTNCTFGFVYFKAVIKKSLGKDSVDIHGNLPVNFHNALETCARMDCGGLEGTLVSHEEHPLIFYMPELKDGVDSFESVPIVTFYPICT